MYARINKDTNQMIGNPQELPDTYQTGNGAVINGFSKLDNSIIFTFGWVPVEYETTDNSNAFVLNNIPEWDSVNNKFIFRMVPRDIKELIVKAENDIDRAASDASFKYMSVGVGQEMRYLEKYNQAVGLLSEVHTVKDITDAIKTKYPMIIAEAQSCNMEIIDKANEVLSTRAQWVQSATVIESLRISGKKKCREASNQLAVLQISSETCSTLGSL